MTKQKRETVVMASFRLPAHLLRFAKRRARARKMGFSEYVRVLIEEDSVADACKPSEGQEVA